MRMRPIERSELARLVQWTNERDEAFLRQWAGPRLRFPLTLNQMEIACRDAVNTFAFEDDEGAFLGSVQLVRLDDDGRNAHLGRFFLDPVTWNGGLSRQALELCVAGVFAHYPQVETLSLNVLVTNARAVACYRHVGFRVQRETTASDGRHVYRMIRERHASDTVRLVQPALCHREAVADFLAEFQQEGQELHGGGFVDQEPSYADWLARLARNGNEATVDEGLVPSSTFFAIRPTDDRLVGIIDLRHRLNRDLLQLGGHIGYSVRASERRQGYARAMLAQALDFYRRRGEPRVLITCAATNIASARTILACRGRLENEVPGKGRITQRYWIDLSNPSEGTRTCR